MTDVTLRTTPEGGELTIGGVVAATLEAGLVELDRREIAKPGDEGLDAEWSATRIGGQDVWELRLVLRNVSERDVTVTRMDPCVVTLDSALGHWGTTWYRSEWGEEFRPRHGTTRHDCFLDVRSGRSSHGTHPWLSLESETTDAAIVITPAWSGNWHIRAQSGGRIAAGISPWQFAVTLAPGESVDAPSVVIAAGSDLERASLGLQRAVRDAWLPRSDFSDAIATEWNHWWPYEDQEVDEQVIWDNAALAAQLGIEVATVDAGWFGDADAASEWPQQRGDWSRVNTERFPSGLTVLGDRIASAGALPGIWIEAEAVGSAARVRAERPDVLAISVEHRRHDPSYRLMTVSLDPDDPGFLGYVCLGSPAGREHVLSSMSELITTFGARWIKLDFNVDPDAGCTRTDHGHGAGDGLFRHYEGLYDVLDAVRERHPDVFLEACASGGFRIDLGLARHVHAFFLSDPDYTEHHLQVLAGASRMLPPQGILHWSQSQWRGDYPPQRLDWSALAPDDFDTMLRSAMLHRFGVSLRLVELPSRLRERLAVHVELFRREFAALVRDGVLRTLTSTPERGGIGERTPIFQLSDEATDRHVLAVFVLAGGARPAAVSPRALRRSQTYRIRDLATGDESIRSGDDLLSAGVALAGGASVTSWLIAVEPQR